MTDLPGSPTQLAAERTALRQRVAELEAKLEAAETARRGAEQALHTNQERHQLAAEAAHVGVWDWDLRTNAFHLDPSIKGILGYRDDETPNELQTWVAHVHADDREPVMAAAQACLDGDTPEYVFEHRMLHKDGSIRWIMVRGRAVRDAAGRPIRMVGTDTDITERKQMERELVRTERLRALGEMAQGISHNLNNMLTSVLGPAQLIQRCTDDPEVLREAEEIVLGAQRARDLVRRLDQAVRVEEEATLYGVAVNEAVQEAVQTTRPRWKDASEAGNLAVEVVTELEEVPPVQGTGTGLLEILTNLLLNAVDALPHGGTITLRTRAVGDHVQLTVSDTGTGMDEETRRRVFEPFFTTKASVGAGLGLSTVYGSVRRWGGRTEVESAPGAGTTFTLWLPVAAEEEKPPDEEPGADLPAVGRGRLLIVEDDESICRVLSQLLSGDHEVDIRPDGRDAVAQFAAGRYAVALIDLALPGLSGDEVARALREADPQLITVLMTGWPLDADDQRSALFDYQLRKPFEGMEEVEGVVRQAVAQHGRRPSHVRGAGLAP